MKKEEQLYLLLNLFYLKDLLNILDPLRLLYHIPLNHQDQIQAFLLMFFMIMTLLPYLNLFCHLNLEIIKHNLLHQTSLNHCHHLLHLY